MNKDVDMKVMDLFWDNFHQKKFAEAEQVFEQMDSKARQEVFAALFQQGQNHRKPHSVSVLFRKLHEDKKFDDFYQAWFPPETKFMISKRVFHNPRTSEPWETDHQIRRTAWIHTLKKAGVRYRNPYQTRHTYASMMLSGGENIMWVAG